jgi:hypothetical protein
LKTIPVNLPLNVVVRKLMKKNIPVVLTLTAQEQHGRHFSRDLSAALLLTCTSTRQIIHKKVLSIVLSLASVIGRKQNRFRKIDASLPLSVAQMRMAKFYRNLNAGLIVMPAFQAQLIHALVLGSILDINVALNLTKVIPRSLNTALALNVFMQHELEIVGALQTMLLSATLVNPALLSAGESSDLIDIALEKPSVMKGRA